ncbi:tetratricopeptide repeat protein [Rheinheimera salexigens]|uniref:Uncharacterized protein n=1 Tax=Rheinheimera salexigens TaxID=1628148 RepID=A0A1E7Q380_9GAMM|nr:tetratricopeptide repeat protein [Rheinheimera salexigens]OEY68642.1 hypothetical protein BI198_02925 [Rheinheimera salexigens]
MRLIILVLMCFPLWVSASIELEPRIIAAAANPGLVSEQLLQKLPSSFTARDYMVLAETQLHLRNKDTALDAINKALSLADSRYLRAYSYLMKAKIYGILFRDTQLAITQLKEAEKLLTDENSRESKSLYGDVLQNFAQAYNQLGQPQNAMPYAQRSLEVALDLQHFDYELRARITIGRLALPNNDFNLAYHQFTEALKLATKLNDLPALASIHFRLGKAFLKLDDTKTALEHFQQALPLYDKLQRKGNYTYILVFIAEAHVVAAENSEGSEHTEHVQLAKESLAKAMVLAREQDDAFRVALILQSYAKVAVIEKQPQQAIQFYSEAIELFRQQNIITTRYEAMINLAEVLYDTNAIEQATNLLDIVEPEITKSAAFMHFRFYSLDAKIAADKQQWQRAYTSLDYASSKRFEQFSSENKLKLTSTHNAINENSELKRQLETAQKYQQLNIKLQNKLIKHAYVIGALLISLVIMLLLWRQARQQQHASHNKTALSDWIRFCQQVQQLEQRSNMSLIAIQLHNSQQLKLELGEPFYHQILDSFIQQLPVQKYLTSCRHNDTIWLALDQNSELDSLQQDLVTQLRQLLPITYQQLPMLCMSFTLNQLIKKPWRVKTLRALTHALWLGHRFAAATAKESNTWLMSIHSDSPSACEWTSAAIRHDLLNTIRLGNIKLYCNGQMIAPSAADNLD